MAKIIKNPVTFSEAYNIDPTFMEKEGVLDPVLNVDTKLFIDPLLLAQSRHKEISVDGVSAYRKRFEQLITLLANSNATDIAWSTAKKLAYFPEITGTSLGYGAGSTKGRAWGEKLRKRLLIAASETIKLGIKDPDLFLIISLLEEGIGPDLISDMATNIILLELEKFNSRICKTLGIETQLFKFKNGLSAKFPKNPINLNIAEPIILVPTDILRELPIATCWDDVADVAQKNADLRNRLNKFIGDIWQSNIKKAQKEELRKEVYSSKEAFEAMLDLIHSVPKKPYDVSNDPEGHLLWMRVRNSIVEQNPLKLSLVAKPTIDQVNDVVTKIVEHYRDLIENKGLWKELWNGSKPRPEKSAQRLFFAVADVYCKINDIDITPEADSGVGPVDFKISSSYSNRVLVELKLSKNQKLVQGYEKQLEAYKKAENTTRATYLVIDVGEMGNKDERIIEIRNKKISESEPASVIEFVNGNKQKSASTR